MMVMTRENPARPIPPEEEQGPEPRKPSPSRPQAGRGPNADALVAQAVAAGTGDPRRAAERLLASAGGNREHLSRARSVLSARLHLRSDDHEGALALRIVERALAAAPHPDGPWRWQQRLSPRRIRATARRQARETRRRRARRPVRSM